MTKKESNNSLKTKKKKNAGAASSLPSAVKARHLESILSQVEVRSDIRPSLIEKWDSQKEVFCRAGIAPRGAPGDPLPRRPANKLAKSSWRITKETNLI